MDTIDIKTALAAYKAATKAAADASMRAELEQMDDASPAAHAARMCGYLLPAYRACDAARAALMDAESRAIPVTERPAVSCPA